MLQLLLLHTVCGIGSLLFQPQSGISPCLKKNEQEHRHQNQDGYQRLKYAPLDRSGCDGADLITDNALPDQVGQEPVRPRHRDIAESLPYAIVNEACLPPVSLREILLNFIKRISILRF